MSRSISIVAVVFLLSAGVAYGQSSGQVVSYFYEGPSGVAFNAPSGGFIVTDIVLANGDGGTTLAISGDQPSVTKLRMQGIFDGKEWHFNSGLSFSEGPVSVAGVGAMEIAFMGYIPCPDPCDPCVAKAGIPAVGNAGLGVMVVFLVAVGGFVLSRRQRQAA